MTNAGYPHITRAEDGWLRVEGLGTRVVEIIQEYMLGRSTPEQLVRFNPALTLGQAHAVMAYYYDHQAEVEAELERFTRFSSELLKELVERDRSRTA